MTRPSNHPTESGNLENPLGQLSLFSGVKEDITEPAASYPSVNRFSDFVVYVDESGDHGMLTVDSNYPMFVLAFCVFHKRHYCEKVVPTLQTFKFNHFGHDHVVLHEHEIRKEKGSFKFQNRQHKKDFLYQLTGIIDLSNFILISCVIDKGRLRDKQEQQSNPYHLALGFCLETLYELMQEKNQDETLTHVVVECRGKKEDNELELEFRRICDGANRQNRRLPFEIVFADKKTNSSGLQLAVLLARPVGLSIDDLINLEQAKLSNEQRLMWLALTSISPKNTMPRPLYVFGDHRSDRSK
jgi:hypothetical protein